MRVLRLAGFVVALAFAPQLACAQSPNKPQFNDRQQVLAIYDTVRVLFDNEAFTTLEKLANEFRSTGAVTSSGRPNLDAYYGAFASYPITGAMSDPRINKTKRWLAAFPKSKTAHIVLAMVLESRAMALGQLAGNSVLAGSKALYETVPAKIENGYKETEQYLIDNDPLLKDEPYYYGLRIDAAARRGAKEEEILALYKSAEKRFPDYFQAKFQALVWLSGLWSDDPTKIDAFISGAAAASHNKNGEGDYADLYWWHYVLQPKGDLPNATKSSWPRIRQGIKDRIMRFGGSSNANRYAMLACRAGDKVIAKSMFEKIGDSFDPEVWDRQTLEQCLFWAVEDRGEPLGRLAEFQQPATLAP